MTQDTDNRKAKVERLKSPSLRWPITVLALFWLYTVVHDDPRQHLAPVHIVLHDIIAVSTVVLAVSSWLDYRKEKRGQGPSGRPPAA